jgi:hypothetical protein
MTVQRLAEACSAGLSHTAGIVQKLARRAVEGGLVVATAIITWHGYWWAFEYALSALAAKQDPIGTAAVLAAILGPLTTFQGFTIAQYIKSNGKQEQK